MSFRPGTTSDLVCPEPHSTTGRAIASLSLRKLNEDFSAFREERIGDEPSRAAFVEFRREMDALLPGRPKARVAVLASPFVRAPLDRSLGGADDSVVEASLAGLFALQMGPGLSRHIALEASHDEVFALQPFVRGTLDGPASFPLPARAIHEVRSWSEGDLLFTTQIASVFGFDARSTSFEERRHVADALRLLDAGASTEIAELPRFFSLVVPIERGLERRPGVLGLELGEGPLAIALCVVEALAIEKLERYARLVDQDASPWEAVTRHAARREFLRRLAAVRHPIAKTPESLGRLAREEEALSQVELEKDCDASLRGLVSELSSLLEGVPI